MLRLTETMVSSTASLTKARCESGGRPLASKAGRAEAGPLAVVSWRAAALQASGASAPRDNMPARVNWRRFIRSPSLVSSNGPPALDKSLERHGLTGCPAKPPFRNECQLTGELSQS